MAVVIEILIVLILVLLAALVAVWISLRHREREMAASAANGAAREYGLAQSHQGALMALESQHAEALRHAEVRHNARVAALAEDVARADERTRTFERMRERLLPQGDRVSRDDIVAVCSKLELDATVFSGIVFRPQDASYYAQIDHLVVVNGRILLIENKYWIGITVHGN